MRRPGRMLITGTRKGIGRYLCEHYVKTGYQVFGCSRTAPDWKLQGYEHFTTDVTDEAGVVSMMREIRKEHGGLDVLVNNAGIASMNHALLTPAKTVERVFATNVFGTFIT